MPEPFFVLATQNPIEQEGTYPLPEAQLDRFMFMLKLDYPSFEEEMSIVSRTTTNVNVQLSQQLHAQDILAFQDIVRRVPVAENLVRYAVQLVHATRPATSTHELVKKYISYGAGPRASQYLILGAKTRAALDGQIGRAHV